MIIFNARPGNGCKISITGPIFDWDSTDFESAVAQADGGPLELWVNSNGGDLQSGFAIRNIIAMYGGEVVVHAIGPVHSAASVAICAKNAHVVAHKGSAFMLHRCSAVYAEGNCEELRKTADVLEKLDGNLVSVYAERLKADEGEIREMLAAETWLNPEEAIAIGLVDEKYEDDPEVPMMDPAMAQKPDDVDVEGVIKRAVAECVARVSDDVASKVLASSKRDGHGAFDVKAACDKISASADVCGAKVAEFSARLDDLVKKCDDLAAQNSDLSKKCDDLAAKNSELSAALSRVYALEEGGVASVATAFKLKY